MAGRRGVVPAIIVLWTLCSLGCGDSTAPTTGSAVIRILTSGTGSIEDGYRVELDGSILHILTAADSLVLDELAPGSHEVLVHPVAGTCSPDWYVPQQIVIEKGQVTPVHFAVRCDTVPAPGLIFSSTLDNFRRNLYRMDPNGGNVQRLTDYPLGDDHPDVSPSGTRVAFQRQAVIGLEQIWLMNVDGSDARKLTGSPLLEQGVEWAPDGRHLAFIRWTTSTLRSLIVSTPDGRQEITIVEDSNGAAPQWSHWSPDGTRLAFTTQLGNRFGIRVVSAVDGSSPIDFLPADTLKEALLSGWTPDGQLLYCRLTRYPELCDIVVSPPGGPTEQVLADSVGGFVSAEYSRDGTAIALTAYDAGGVFDIFSMPASGGALTNLTNTPLKQELTPSWVP